MTLTVYGLANCDTCRKARKWLDAKGIAHNFHDVRKDGITADDVSRWAKAAGWEMLFNRRGTTWRGLSDAEKADVDEAGAIALMAAHPALIKRPVFENGGTILVGFAPGVQDALKAAK